ncbi:MAG TPA: LPS assembly protein LptD [Oligoflexia bacterium]|nr:LPS assembly protein LptD [Oligoflexia bacterium]
MRLLSALLGFFLCYLNAPALAQSVARPNQRKLFDEDLKDNVIAARKLQADAAKTQDNPKQEIDIESPSLSMDRESEVVFARDGVVLSKGLLRASARESDIDTKNKEAELRGDVYIGTPEFSLNGDKARFNFEEETGNFHDSYIEFEEGGYGVASEYAQKLSEFEYEFKNLKFSTCHCEDCGQDVAKQPWYFTSSRTFITQDGHGHAYNVVFRFKGVPLIYVPYFFFPAKVERSSGLLAPTFGFSNQDGFQYRQPIYIVPSDTNELLITPFTETRSRNGAWFDYRHSFVNNNSLRVKLLYSNEGPRGNSARGLQIADAAGRSFFHDPTIDTNRIGAYVSQLYRTEPEALLPTTIVTDAHFASDNLMIREIEDNDIALPDAAFLSSSMVARSQLGRYLTAELAGEYNQTIFGNQDLDVFQRAPRVSLYGGYNLDPFGKNMLGAKLRLSGMLNYTNFYRSGEFIESIGEKVGFDGSRVQLAPRLEMPFHYKNYFNGSVNLSYLRNIYNLDNRLTVSGEELDSSSSNDFVTLSAGLGTAFERVYELPEDNILTYLTSLGTQSQSADLKRVKHTFEPFVGFLFSPPASQDRRLIFDSTDVNRQRSQISYGFSTSLLGRFLPKESFVYQSRELAPRVEDLNLFETRPGVPELDDFGGARGGSFSTRRGSISELARFSLQQVYDFVEKDKDLNPNIRPLSDLTGRLLLFPSAYTAFDITSTFSTYDRDVTSLSLATNLSDDRGDVLRLNYLFISPQEDATNPNAFVRQRQGQLEAQLQLTITDQVKLGYYTRYDDKTSTFIENRSMLRFIGSCNCWSIDVGYRDRANPDRQNVFVNLNLLGVGSLNQQLMSYRRNQSNLQ